VRWVGAGGVSGKLERESIFWENIPVRTSKPDGALKEARFASRQKADCIARNGRSYMYTQLPQAGKPLKDYKSTWLPGCPN